MTWIDVKEAITHMYARFGRPLDRGMLNMELADYQSMGHPADRIYWALGEYRRTTKQTRPPLLSEIKAILEPQADPEAVANDAAGKVVKAVHKFGWNNSREAREFLGPYWAVVERFGGWSYICENMGVLFNQATFYAQARDTAKALITEKRLGQPLAQQLEPAKGGEQKELERLDFKQLTTRGEND